MSRIEWRRAGARVLLAGLCAVATGVAWAEETFDCVVQPARIVALGSPVTGVLAEVLVTRGQVVQAGDVVARLEDSVERAALALQRTQAEDRSSLRAQEARLALATARMERVRQLLDRGAATQEAFDEAEAELMVARAEIDRLGVELHLAGQELDRAQATLDRRTIRSPMDGVVTRRLLQPGEFVTQEAAVAEIAALDPLHVETFLPAAYYPQLSVGMAARVALRQPEGQEIVAQVGVIDRVFDATSGTFGLRLDLPNPEGAFPAGQRCSVSFEIEPVKGVAENYGLR
ncbi:efflux RND transporter periplasmic adaptor subunit [Pseudooceanicola nanhaiensis]|uniref:efflux RND transporter periplasmic adaptor subunit n=1 Tax=Pseudooceanicola nanhaiensis TaxID=375761 RepID=UPI001CD256ED|nr:efflux RND transporter periplasmic adaptor subunit [Pseudooceanicola nanhaiensis]MCA0921682.1 efflux RND transporter periplasmic adaptor subunit [Pseudooceanicola nanhaiensis]